MLENVIREVAIKEVNNIPEKVQEKKAILHSQFSTEKKSIDGLFLRGKDLSVNNSFEGIEKKRLSFEEVKEYFSKEGPYLRSMEERKIQALKGEGEWFEEESSLIFIPSSEKARSELKESGIEGIIYDKYAEPYFEKVSKVTVQIENMTSERYGPGGNFEKANKNCAEKWNEEGFEDKYDWIARDVEKWRNDPEHRYTWHERSDMKTMDLVPNETHDKCKHYGGCAECKARDGLLGGNKYDN